MFKQFFSNPPLQQAPMIFDYESFLGLYSAKTSPNPTFPPLLPQIISGNQESKLGQDASTKLSEALLNANFDQANSLGILLPDTSTNSQTKKVAISLDQIKNSLSSESLASLSGERTSARLKTALALYNQYFQDNFPGEEYNELRNHLKQRLLTSPYTENLHKNINASTDLGKIKQTCNEIGEFFSIIALKVEAIKSGDQAIDVAKEKDELKTLLTIFPSNQDADYACLEGTRQRLQTGTFSLFKPDVIAQLLEQEIDIFLAQHAKEVKEGNQIHMKSCLYGAISSLPYAELAKIDGFFLNPQDGLQLKDVLEFVDNLDDKIKQGLKTRISEIEEQFDKIFVQENTPPTAGMIKDFNSFLKINGFKEIDDAEFYETFCDENYLITKDSKDKLRIELLKSITATYPTLDKAKLEELFLEDTQQQYLSTKIDLFYDDLQSSQQLDVGKIGNLIAIFRDNSTAPEPNIANIEKGLIVLRDVAQNFKNSNPFYFLEFFKQFKTSTGTTFEDYFFEPSSQSQSQPSQPRQVKSQFKEFEGIIKDITTREKNLSNILLQKPANQTIVQSPEEIARNQEIFDVCNAIFLGKEDEESKRKIQAFKDKLLIDPSLADATYSFFLARDNIFIKKLIESDNDKALAKLIDILPPDHKEGLKLYRPDGYNNLLHIASIVGSSKVIGALNSAGFNINQSNPSGYTALMIASQIGHISAVQALINAGATVDKIDKNKNSALIMASSLGLTEVVRKLIEAKANVNLQGNGEQTALMLASKNGHASVVEALIEGGANVNENAKDGNTTLMIASKKGYTSIAKALIKAGADVDFQPNLLSKTALMIASQNGHIDIVKELIKARASVDIQAINRYTALMFASLSGHASVVEALIKAGTNVNEKARNGNTALLMASDKGHTSVVDALIEQNADVNSVDANGTSALFIASQNGYVDIVKALIKAGATIDTYKENRVTALMIASSNGNAEIVKTLIEAGANVDSADKFDITALISASENGHTAVVNLLLQNGANLTGINNEFLQSIESQDIKNTLQKYQDFYDKKNDKEILDKIEESLKEYLNKGKESTQLFKITFEDRNQQHQEIELNFNAISKIYEEDKSQNTRIFDLIMNIRTNPSNLIKPSDGTGIGMVPGHVPSS